MLGRAWAPGSSPAMHPPFAGDAETEHARRSRLMEDPPVDAAELAALAETEALNQVLDLLRRELEI